jgi:hypothetical protein
MKACEEFEAIDSSMRMLHLVRVYLSRYHTDAWVEYRRIGIGCG